MRDDDNGLWLKPVKNAACLNAPSLSQRFGKTGMFENWLQCYCERVK